MSEELERKFDAVARAALPFCGLDSCNRIKYGQCTVRACLVRGGYRGRGPVDAGIATCDALALALAVGEMASFLGRRVP